MQHNSICNWQKHKSHGRIGRCFVKSTCYFTCFMWRHKGCAYNRDWFLNSMPGVLILRACAYNRDYTVFQPTVHDPYGWNNRISTELVYRVHCYNWKNIIIYGVYRTYTVFFRLQSNLTHLTEDRLSWTRERKYGEALPDWGAYKKPGRQKVTIWHNKSAEKHFNAEYIHSLEETDAFASCGFVFLSTDVILLNFSQSSSVVRSPIVPSFLLLFCWW